MLHEVAGFVGFGLLTGACFVFARRFAAQAGRRGLGDLLVPHRAGNARLHSGGVQRVVERHCGQLRHVFQRLALAARWVLISLLALRVIRETEVVDGS